MKLVSLTLCAALLTFARAADAPKAPAPATPTSPDDKPPAGQQAPIITLDAPPRLGSKGANPDQTLKLQPAPGAPLRITPAVPPGQSVAPGDNPGPVTTFKQERAPLAPGIYIASPYTGIVVVPPLMDERMLEEVSPGSSKMSTAAPELRLTPKTK